VHLSVQIHKLVTSHVIKLGIAFISRDHKFQK